MRQVPLRLFRDIKLAAFHSFLQENGVFQMNMPKFLVFIPLKVRLFFCDVKVYTLRHTANKKNCP